jgi:triosephosphate isomerase
MLATRDIILSMQKKLIIGNWKMNPRTLREAKAHFAAIKKEASKYKNVEAVIAAPYIYLPDLAKLATVGLALGAQNVSSEKEGAHTGEISASMIASCKAKYVIVGHSERRALGESNAFISKKMAAVLAAKMTPVLCVGEVDRDSGMWYLGTVKTQLEECLAGLPKSAVSRIVIAYEPVWAISTSENHRDATPEDAIEMRIYIQKVLADMFGHGAGDKVRILYGGSVDEKNAIGFLITGRADGLLPGRASLTPKKFAAILQVANSIKE